MCITTVCLRLDRSISCVENELRKTSTSHRRHGLAESGQFDLQNDAGGFTPRFWTLWRSRRYLHTQGPLHQREPRLRFRAVSAGMFSYVNVRLSWIWPRSFYDKRDAEDALDAMDGRMLDGRELRVQMARYGRPTSPHRRYGRSGRRRWVSRDFCERPAQNVFARKKNTLAVC